MDGLTYSWLLGLIEREFPLSENGAACARFGAYFANLFPDLYAVVCETDDKCTVRQLDDLASGSFVRSILLLPFGINASSH